MPLFYVSSGDIAPREGLVYGSLTGVLHYAYENTKLEPRFAEDYVLGEEPHPVEGTMRVTFIDVGQGDSTLLELPGGEVILIDGGDEGAGNEFVLPVLNAKGISTIDLMVLTHPHADHCGGLDEVLVNTDVLEVWENGETTDTSSYRSYSNARNAEGAEYIRPYQGYVRQFGDVWVEVLNRAEGYEGENNDSLVLMISFGETNVLMTGDVEWQEQQDLLNDYSTALESEIQKVPHHGSDSYYYPFVAVSSPEYVSRSARTTPTATHLRP